MMSLVMSSCNNPNPVMMNFVGNMLSLYQSYLLELVPFESIVDDESELRKLPEPLTICQLPTLIDEEDSCR